MKLLASIWARLRGITISFGRYPLTIIFLLAATVFQSMAIATEKNYSNILWACAVGAVLSAALQTVYERFFENKSSRLLLQCVGLLITTAYYLLIRSAPSPGIETEIRTSITILALFAAFIWVPVIKSKFSFNDSFIAAFKAFFMALLFSGVLYIGFALVLASVDTLITPVQYKLYDHTANIVFVLFAPTLFLSFIPRFSMDTKDRRETESQSVRQAISIPRFAQVLISSIVIPMAMAFTLILIVYIATNIKGAFWTNNLMEPMLISYAIAIILLNFLASGMENRVSKLFCLSFPKILIPIVLFQIAASVFNLRESGLTHTRYLVILFGLFAVCSGIVLSIAPMRKNGIIAAMFIAFSLVSILPPIDAFSLSRRSQTNVLESTLAKNGMLVDGRIVPNVSIPDEDKKKIVYSVEYLVRMGYAENLLYIPKGFSMYENFTPTFGFNAYDLPNKAGRGMHLVLSDTTPLDIKGYDVLAKANIDRTDNAFNDDLDPKICEIQKNGKQYLLTEDKTADRYDFVLLEADNRELIRFDTNRIFDRYGSYPPDKTSLSALEATFDAENENAKISVVVWNLNTNFIGNSRYHHVELYVMIQFK